MKKTSSLAALFLFIPAFSVYCATDPATPAAAPGVAAPAPAAPAAPADEADSKWKDSFDLALGVGLTIPKQQNITGTTVQNGIVRITEEQKYIPSLWLTTQFVRQAGVYTTYGPFIGLGLTSENGIFSQIGGGLLISFSRSKFVRGKSQPSLNIGIGYAVQKVKVLGDGVNENQALPQGEEAVRMKTKYVPGPLVLFSFSVS